MQEYFLLTGLSVRLGLAQIANAFKINWTTNEICHINHSHSPTRDLRIDNLKSCGFSTIKNIIFLLVEMLKSPLAEYHWVGKLDFSKSTSNRNVLVANDQSWLGKCVDVNPYIDKCTSWMLSKSFWVNIKYAAIKDISRKCIFV